MSLTTQTVYVELCQAVEQTLLQGQRDIEKARVHTYWKTGKLIAEHIEKYKKDDEHFGHRLVEKLAKDLKISSRSLWECIQFSRVFKILRARAESTSDQLTWTHYRKLMAVQDESTRLDLMNRAEMKGWTSDELAQKIQQEVPRNGNSKPRKAVATEFKLVPKRGELWTYQLMKRPTGELVLDLGFQFKWDLPAGSSGWSSGQVAESVKTGELYSLKHSGRGEKDLYTYQASVERVIDGDTILADIDLGFGGSVRQYLRLRGINCPEIDTSEGKKARDFVQKAVDRSKSLVVRTYKAEKYGRYLADIFCDDLYLNQELLNNALADRYDGG